MSTAVTHATGLHEAAVHADAAGDGEAILGMVDTGRRPDLLATAQARLLGNYRQAPIVLDHGRGCEVWDTQGRRYLDLCAGVAVSALGHAHPRLTTTLAAQAGRLMHASNYFYN